MLKDNDFVRLKKEAITRFYGTDRMVDMYTIGGKIDNFDTKAFVELVSDYLAFYNGERAGIVSGKGNDKDVYRVRYFSDITGTWSDSFFNINDLDKVDIT